MKIIFVHNQDNTIISELIREIYYLDLVHITEKSKPNRLVIPINIPLNDRQKTFLSKMKKEHENIVGCEYWEIKRNETYICALKLKYSSFEKEEIYDIFDIVLRENIDIPFLLERDKDELTLYELPDLALISFYQWAQIMYSSTKWSGSFEYLENVNIGKTTVAPKFYRKHLEGGFAHELIARCLK
jgi:hypothetical protein